MRQTEFWTRMEEALGAGYARTWAQLQVITEVDGRTVDEALAAGIAPKAVWRAVWEHLQLPVRER